MTKLVVLYKRPADSAHFDKHYREVHMPLVEKFPGIKNHSFGPATGPDGKDGAFFWMFVGSFDSAEALGKAMASPEGRAAVADIPNFSPDAPTILVLDATEG